jgi:DNA replication and repair protein RecF
MAGEAVAVAAARRDVLARLQAAEAAAPASAFPRAGLGIAGEVEGLLDDRPALAAEDAFRERLAARRRIDQAAGAATDGPHRTDLVVEHREKAMPAAQCSTGEQKALLIGIVLANARLIAAERGSPPVLLLDEVAAHLDEGRRAALFEQVLGLGAQAWLTGTDASLFAPLGARAQFLGVADAVITNRSEQRADV